MSVLICDRRLYIVAMWWRLAVGLQMGSTGEAQLDKWDGTAARATKGAISAPNPAFLTRCNEIIWISSRLTHILIISLTLRSATSLELGS